MNVAHRSSCRSKAKWQLTIHHMHLDIRSVTVFPSRVGSRTKDVELLNLLPVLDVLKSRIWQLFIRCSAYAFVIVEGR